MAYIKGYTVTEYTAATSTWAADEMPEHASGDLLIVMMGTDGSITMNDNASGWTRDITQTVTGGGVHCFSMRADSDSETFSCTSSASDTGVLVVVSVGDVYGSSLSDAWDLSPVVAGSDATTNPCAGVSGQSTSYDNSLIIRCMGGDGGQSPTAYPPNVNLYCGDASQGSLGVAYTVQEDYGSISQAYWYVRLDTENQREILMAVRNVASGKIAPFADPATTTSTFHRALGWATTGTPFADSWPTSLSIATIGGVTLTYDVGAAAADGGTNPYADGLNFTPGSSTTVMYGTQINFASALDMDTGIIYMCFRPTLHRDGAVDPGKLSLTGGGLNVIFLDTSSNYAAYIVYGRDAVDVNKTGYNTVGIDWNGSAEAWATSGTINKSAVTEMIIAGRGYYGAIGVCFSMLCQVSQIGIAGGSSSSPLNFDDLDAVLNNCCGILPLFIRSASQARIYTPIQIGGGAPVSISVNLRTFVFPDIYEPDIKLCTWNAAANVAGIEFYPQSGDTIEFTNCLFNAEAPYRWEFNASSATSGWTGDFTGTTVVGAAVSLRPVMTFENMTFINCFSFDLNSAVIDSCSFTGTTISADSPADVADISNCDFTMGEEDSHAIEITGTAASFALDGVSFTGYATSDGSNGDECIYVNIASGTMTISITGGGDTPTIRTAGATVTVVNARTVSVTVLDADDSSEIENARVAVWATTGASVTITRSGSTATVAHSTHPYESGDEVVIFGSDQGEYNGIKTVTYVDANSYSFTVSGTPTTPATGTITSHTVILSDLTDANGVVEDTAYPYTGDLAISGRVRKGNAYKTAPISGTITSASGFETTVFMVSDA